MKSIIQPIENIEAWHSSKDPWKYKGNKDDMLRREILLSELSNKQYKNVLDIGCGQGFITKHINAQNVVGVDISKTAIEFAEEECPSHVTFKQGSIFEVDQLFDTKFDLIVITGVLYKQYIGDASNLIYLLIDRILEHGGNLISVHINEWAICKFPYLKIKEIIYPYREYNHKLEIFTK